MAAISAKIATPKDIRALPKFIERLSPVAGIMFMPFPHLGQAAALLET
jgi:hypothetical protein